MSTQQNNNQFKLLMTKDIYNILDGDRSCGTYRFEDDNTTVPIKMPYLKGLRICNISKSFGLPAEYGSQSRWQYMEDLLRHCIEEGTCSNLLSYLFGKGQFAELFSGHSASAVEKAYPVFVEEILKKINVVLWHGGNEVRVIDEKFVIRKIGSKVNIAAPKIKSVNQQRIKDMYDRALEDINQGNFDSAITKSRTLLEETFVYLIEKQGADPSKSGNIKTLYAQVKTLYKMHGNAGAERYVNELLSGLEKILSSVSEMRNKFGDAHGLGSTRSEITEPYVRLFVNAAAAMAEFVLSLEKEGLAIK